MGEIQILFFDSEVAPPLHVYAQMSPLSNDEEGNNRGKKRGRPTVSDIDRLAGSAHDYVCGARFC